MKRAPVDHDIEAIRAALHDASVGGSIAARGDARDRALKVRHRHAAAATWAAKQAAIHLEKAEALMEQAEAIGDWRYRPGDVVASRVDDAGEHIDRAIEHDAKAAISFQRIADVDRLLRRYGQKPALADEVGPTLEMVQKMASGAVGDPLARLCALGHLTDDDVRCGREIARVFEYATAKLGAKTANYPVASEIPQQPGESRRLHAMLAARDWFDLLHAFVYRPWAAKNRAVVALVLGLCVEGRSIESLRRQFGGRWLTQVHAVRDALRDYGRLRGRYMREA